MHTIIAPTDFSESSIDAVSFAAAMALAAGATLHIYHAVPDRAVLIDDRDYDVHLTETETGMRQLEWILDKTRRETHHRLQVEVQLKYGDIGEVLAAACKPSLPFAIVMPATQKTGWQRFFLGSETVTASQKIAAPIIFIPQHTSFEGIQKVAIASDLDDVYDTMPLDNIAHWLDTFNPALDIIFVQEKDHFDGIKVAEAVALQTHFDKYQPTMQYITDKDIAEGINTYVNNMRPDLLILVPKKHFFFHKSLSRQFILHPAVPTMVLSGE